jgi:hypothetical protein
VKSIGRELGFAVLAWLTPFVTSICVFQLKATHRPLFEMIMSLTLTANTALLGLIYLRRATERRMIRATWIGIIWMISNWTLDLVMFSSGPMQMTFHQYLMEIAGAYFVIPVITLALSAAATPATRMQSPVR